MKSYDEKAQTVFDQLDKAFSDKEIKADKELSDMILDAARELEKDDDYHLIATKLCCSISGYCFTHHNRLPKALHDLYMQLRPIATAYQGIATSALMMPVWF